MSAITTGEPGREGFAGTVPGFLDWLQEQLRYGGVGISDLVLAEASFDKRTVRRVELVTGGYSDDEHLLGRVYRGSMFALKFWRSLHLGGRYVYEVPFEHFDSPQEITWLQPESDVFEQLHRAREVIVRTPQGDEFSVSLPHGAQLSFSEHGFDGRGRDIDEPAGVLLVEPIDEPH